MKKLLIALAILVVIVAGVLIVVFQMTAGITETADGFFSALQENDISELYDKYLSEGFRTETTLDELKIFLKQSNLIEFQSVSCLVQFRVTRVNSRGQLPPKTAGLFR